MKTSRFEAVESALTRLGMRPMFGACHGHGHDVHLVSHKVEHMARYITAYDMSDDIIDVVLSSKEFDKALYTTLVGIGLSVEACLLASLS